MINPFLTAGYAGPEYFCDRIQETQDITDMLVNENNLALISPRRIGKTELITHVFNQPRIKEGYYCFLIDIYSTTSLRDFVNVFGKAVIEVLRSRGRKAWELFINALSSLRSEISFDINGNPVWGMGLGAINNPEVTLDEIFRYLSMADKPCLVAIDEFQQITKYSDGANVEATLRTYIQRCTNAHFVFSGSQRTMMGEMFLSPARPFYQSVTIMNLQAIPYDKYLEFVKDKFEKEDKRIDEAVVTDLYERFEAVTSYMHRVLNVLFARTAKGECCGKEEIDEAVGYILRLSSDTYESLFYQMPEKQRNVFVAIAKEGKAQGVTSGAFVKKYRLPSPSSVSSAIKGLLEKEFITVDKNVYTVYDQFFVLWMSMKGVI